MVGFSSTDRRSRLLMGTLLVFILFTSAIILIYLDILPTDRILEFTVESSAESGCMFSANHCPPDVFGRACDHDVFRSLRYLPDPLNPFNATKLSNFDCPYDLENTKRISELHNRLDALQESCYRRVLTALTPYSVNGFATIMHYLTFPMTEAYERGHIFVLNDIPLISDLKDCPSFSCFFEKWTNCEVDKSNKFSLHSEHPYPYRIPNNFREKGTFWWKSQLLSYYLTPNKKMEQLLNQLKQNLGWSHPIIGMHIRHGERCSDENLPPCKAISHYFEEATILKNQYGVDRIFLATDDPSVKKQILDHAKGFKVVWVTESMLNVKLIVEKRPPMDFSLASIVDLLLLSHTDYLITGLISNQGRLALELMFAHHGCLRPYISVDIPWCSHYGHKWDTGSVKEFQC